MTPKRGQIENSFKLMKHYVSMNAHTKFGSNPTENLRENWWQLEIANFF